MTIDIDNVHLKHRDKIFRGLRLTNPPQWTQSLLNQASASCLIRYWCLHCVSLHLLACDLPMSKGSCPAPMASQPTPLLRLPPTWRSKSGKARQGLHLYFLHKSILPPHQLLPGLTVVDRPILKLGIGAPQREMGPQKGWPGHISCSRDCSLPEKDLQQSITIMWNLPEKILQKCSLTQPWGGA